MSEYYFIHTKNRGTYAAKANLDTVTAQVVGQTNRYTFWVPENNGDKTFTSDYTISADTGGEYDSITINAGVTVTVNGLLQCNDITVNGDLVVNGEVIVYEGDARSNILEFGEYANKYKTSRMVDGTLKYRDRIPDSSDIESLVVGIEPATELQNADVKGTWGVIDAVIDERNPVFDVDRITLEITNLAEYTDYSNHDLLESDLKL